MQIPWLPIDFSNWIASHSLVNMSPNCFSVTILSFTYFLMKWWIMYMRFKILLLTHNNVMTYCSILYSFNIWLIHSNLIQLIFIRNYPSFVTDTITPCFLSWPVRSYSLFSFPSSIPLWIWNWFSLCHIGCFSHLYQHLDHS